MEKARSIKMKKSIAVRTEHIHTVLNGRQRFLPLGGEADIPKQ